MPRRCCCRRKPVLLPAEAGGHLVVCTPINWIIALDPATGEERWRFDPEIDLNRFAGRFNCRGTTPWRDPDASVGQACAWRLFRGTVDRRIVAIDAASGKPCEDFGEQGIVDVNPHVIAIGPGAERDDQHRQQSNPDPARVIPHNCSPLNCSR